MLWNQTVGRVSSWFAGFLSLSRVSLNSRHSPGLTLDGLVPAGRHSRRMGKGSEGLMFVGLCQRVSRPLAVTLISRRNHPPSLSGSFDESYPTTSSTLH